MSDFVVSETIALGSNEAILVKLEQATNVRVMTPFQYSSFQARRDHHAVAQEVRTREHVVNPGPGQWKVVLDLALE